MKRKVLAVLTVAGVLGVTGAAFADLNIKIDVDAVKFRPIAQAKTQPQRPPEPPKDEFKGQRPPMSRDMRGNPPEPPKGDKRPPMSGDRQPPPKPRSGDRRPPEFRSNDKRPEMPKGWN